MSAPMNVLLLDPTKSDCQDERSYALSDVHKVAMALVELTGSASNLVTYANDPAKRQMIANERADLFKAKLAIEKVPSATKPKGKVA